jgi:hypothetical protein
MTDEPLDLQADMTDAERVLLEHRAAVRVNLPDHARHAAETIRNALSTATYASMSPPPEVLAAALAVERWARDVRDQVQRDRHIRQRTGASEAAYQRAIERAQARAPGAEHLQEQGSSPAPGPLWVGGLGPGRDADHEQERGWER